MLFRDTHAQHHVTWVDDDHVLVFDNGESRSRVLEIAVESGEVTWSFEGDPPQQFHSNYISGADRLWSGSVLVCEGASMPCSTRAIEIFMDKPILFAPSKAANAGGVAVSGLEMVQNSMRLTWTAEEVNSRLKIIMSGVHQTCLDTAEQYGTPGNLLNGAQIASFVKVADAMMDQGVV